MSVPKRFGVLRFFGTLLKVLAWIVLVVGIIGAILAAIGVSAAVNVLFPDTAAQLESMGGAGGIVIGIGLLLTALMWFLILTVAGEQIHLSIAVEENTRLTAALLLKMHQDGQAEGSAGTYGAGGGGGFVNEPYDN